MYKNNNIILPSGKGRLKKPIAALILLLFCLIPLLAEPCGDVNSDGSIDIIDALFVEQYVNGLDPEPFDVSAAEVSGDGDITIADSHLIAMYYIGDILYFPGCVPAPLEIFESCGDVNSDGNIDMVDALFVEQYINGLDPEPFDVSAAEVSGDCDITTSDSLLIGIYYIGDIPYLPGCVSTTCGDVDSNWIIDIVDALMTAQYYVGLDPPCFDPGVADVNGDGKIDIVDALLIAQYSVGLISILMGCEPPPTPIPYCPSQTYEFQAETEATWDDGSVESYHSGYTGSGYVNTANSAGNWIEWTVDITEASSAVCVFTYACASDARPMDLSVNGSFVTNLGFPASGAWTSWYTQTAAVNLDAGTNAIRLTAAASSGAANMDKMDITVDHGCIVTPIPTPTPTPTDWNPTPDPEYERALQIARNFIDMQEIKSAEKKRINVSHLEYYEVIGSTIDGKVKVGVDLATGTVIQFQKICPFPGLYLYDMRVNQNNAMDFCLAFLQRNDLPPIPQNYQIVKSKVREVSEYKHYQVVFRQSFGEVALYSNAVSFLFNGEGKIVSYSRIHNELQVPIDPTVDQDQAVALAREALKKISQADLDVTGVALKVVYPNSFFDKYQWQWSEEQALVYVVQFGTGGNPALEIWIDAHDGQLQGGEMFERPIPELIGIPFETGDITGIWEPALDIMQYNTIHTVLADTPEADVINAIENGYIFILQTHGSTTPPAEYAVIGHSGTFDERTLEPHEVPPNNLYYALVSCCHSGHDGTGDDFKDTFLDQGALCFQGYEPSINPDPYEQALVSYLAEGWSLANSDWFAQMDTAPWFDIIIRWQNISCLNKIRLAPIQVTVDAPDAAMCAFTVNAYFYNAEAALGTTATDLLTYIELPPGFTIGSPLIQTTPALAYDASWTATWTVFAPIFTYGDFEFDVIARTDNLGVTVDDFENPYHKFSVHVQCEPTMPMPEQVIYEYFRWWEWAAALYSDYYHSTVIMVHKDTFIDKFSSDDYLERITDGYINMLKIIADRELQFADEFIGRQQVEPVTPAIAEYQDAVSNKINFLNGISSGAEVEAVQFLHDMVQLQVMVNEKATVAFVPDPASSL